MSCCFGKVTLPDGRKLSAIEHGTYEYDTNAWVPHDEGMTLTDVATGEALSLDAMNAEILHEGRTYYLHEYVSKYATWVFGPDEEP